MVFSAHPFKVRWKNKEYCVTLALLQDSFLNSLCSQRVLVSVYLVNGIKLQGYITAFDQHVVLLKNTSEQIIFKHAIATVVANANVAPRQADYGMDEEDEIELGCLEEG